MDDEIEEGAFEGIWYRSLCPACQGMNDTEGGIRGLVVKCDECGLEYKVVGS